MRKYVFSVLILFSLVSAAFGHSWYPYECCSGQDCFPIPCEEIVEKSDKLMQWGEHVFSDNQIRPSQDGKCHACIYQGNPRCLFIQQGS